jgi:light-regulated signal transduction histidine kinase (bacteriophytochrome)
MTLTSQDGTWPLRPVGAPAAGSVVAPGKEILDERSQGSRASDVAPGRRRRVRRARAELEREVVRLERRVAELEDQKATAEALAGVAAHELMEPLVMAEAYAVLLNERLGNRLDHEARDDLAALVRGAARMRLLVETLLHDARSAARPLKRSSVDLERIVHDCIGLLGPEISLRRARITVLPMPVVRGDAALLTGVIQNLLVNALKYGPRRDGEICIEANWEGSQWRIGVASMGRPIEPHERERIFEPFERGRTERRARGTGLGLAICRRIVERHGGKIGVQPRPQGNLFYFTLPADGAHAPAAARASG